MNHKKPKGAALELSADRLSALCYELALMHKAGVGLEDSFSILRDDCTTPKETELFGQIYQGLAQGKHLSEALSLSGVFPHYMLKMIDIGQASGQLEEVFFALSTFYRKEADTNSAFRKAITYPMGMAFLISLVFLVLISQVLPVFEQVFAQLGIALSPMAKALMSLGSASKYVAIVVSILLIGFAFLCLWVMKTKAGAAWLNNTINKRLGKSRLLLSTNRSRFTAAMALMLSSGLPIDEAMYRTQELLSQSSFAENIKQCVTLMESGTNFPAAVEKSGILNAMQAGLLTSGFRVGLPEQSMEELSARCQDEADELLATFLGRFEYIMVILLCATVGLVLLSVMMPLLGVLSGIGA